MQYDIYCEKMINGKSVKLRFHNKKTVMEVKRITEIGEHLEPKIDIIALRYKSSDKGAINAIISKLFNVVNQIFDQQKLMYNNGGKKD